jgi:hypothetical protein
MTPRWLAPALGAALATVFSGASARADGVDPAGAEAVFLQGRTAMDAGHFEEACSKFAESERLDPAAGTLMNLATCEEKVGRLASAWQHWREAIDLLPAGDDRRAFARGRVDELEKRLPHLMVKLAGQSDGARVLRDGVELGAASRGVQLPVDPGAHEVTVEMPGHRSETVTIVLGEAEHKSVEVHAGEVEPAAIGGAVPTSRGGMRTLGWVLGSVGVASSVTAAVTSVLLVKDKSTADANCPNKTCVNQKGLDAVSQGKTLTVVNAAAFAVGAAGLGLGAYLVLSNRQDGAAATIGPGVVASGAGLTCVGAF